MTKQAWKTERTCTYCNKPFIPIYKPQRYCSRKCSMDAVGATKQTRVELDCSRCGKKFMRVPSAIHEEQNFCSMKCRKEPGTEKRCEQCDKPFITRRDTRFCSKKCANTGEHNGMYGKGYLMKDRIPWTKGKTAKTDTRIAELGRKISIKSKQQFADGTREKQYGKNNPNYGNTRDKRTPEQLESYSKAAIQRVQEGRSCNHKFFKRGWYTSDKTNEKMFYRSSYELIVMKYFDTNQDIVYYKYEPFVIHYGIGKRYLPDFLVYYKDKKVLLEVKNNWNKDLPETREKAEAARSYCKEKGWEFELWAKDKVLSLQPSTNS